MLRTARARARAALRRPAPPSTSHRRPASSFPGASPPPPPPPPPPRVYIQPATIYPFILLSIITSLALNLGHQRTARDTEAARYRAQLSVLESLLARATATARPLSERDQDDIERELELVGLGRGRDKAVVGAETSVREATSWTEVFFGKKGKAYEQVKDDTDWDKVFREADEAEKIRQSAPPPAVVPAASSPALSPVAAVSSPAPLPPSSSPAQPPTPVPQPPPPAKPTSKAVYL
ncbi:hypothetical protein JCM3775_007082 [Rhodotorula graminis]